MFSDLWPTISSVLGVILVISIGGLGRYLGWLRSDADQSLAKLTTFVLMPAFFIDRISASAAIETASDAWLPPLVGFLWTAGGLVVALVIARTLGPRIGLETDAKQRSFAICVGICNYGYIPLPLAMKFYPDAVVDLILHNAGVDLALWSVGIAVLCGLTGGGLRHAFLNPPFIAVIFALVLKQTGATLPDFLMDAAGLLGACAIPIGLVLSGAIFADFFREADWKGSLGTIVAAITIRQLLMPVLLLLAAGALITSVDLRQVVMLQAAMPTAIFPIVLIRLYKKDTATALRVVLTTYVAAIVLIPLWITLGKWWLGIV